LNDEKSLLVLRVLVRIVGRAVERLTRIVVMPTMQKQGIGSILLKYIIKAMADKGYDDMRFMACKK